MSHSAPVSLIPSVCRHFVDRWGWRPPHRDQRQEPGPVDVVDPETGSQLLRPVAAVTVAVARASESCITCLAQIHPSVRPSVRPTIGHETMTTTTATGATGGAAAAAADSIGISDVVLSDCPADGGCGDQRQEWRGGLSD